MQQIECVDKNLYSDNKMHEIVKILNENFVVEEWRNNLFSIENIKTISSWQCNYSYDK